MSMTRRSFMTCTAAAMALAGESRAAGSLFDGLGDPSPLPAITTRVIGLGDSIMVGKHANGRNFIWHALQGFPGWQAVNLGAGGTTMQQTLNQRAVAASRRLPALERNIFFIHSGTNDIAQSATSQLAGLDLVIYEQRLAPLVSYLKGLGPDVRVVVNTIMPRQWLGDTLTRTARETARLRYNERLIRTDLPVTVCDVGSMADFGPLDTLGAVNPQHYVADRVHLRESGYAVCARDPLSAVQIAWRDAARN